jgi:sulfur carrier protein ThiS
MKLTIITEKTGTKEKINFSGKTVKELLEFLKINPEIIIPVRKNEVLTEEDELKDNDKVEILSVISGG